MRSVLVVELAPCLNQQLGFGPRAERFPVEQFIAQLAVKVLDDAVLPRLARRDEGRHDGQAFARVLVQQPKLSKRQAMRCQTIDYANMFITCHELQSNASGYDPKCEDCATVVGDGDI